MLMGRETRVLVPLLLQPGEVRRGEGKGVVGAEQRPNTRAIPVTSEQASGCARVGWKPSLANPWAKGSVRVGLSDTTTTTIY